MTDDLQGAQITAVEGRDGWLFLQMFDGLDAIALFSDETSMSEWRLARWARTLEQRRCRFAERSLPLVSIVAPESYVVYADKLPEGMVLAPTSPFERIRARLSAETAAEILYPRDELIAGRSQEETYEQVDTHWTDWGAYIAYRLLMQRVREVLPNARLIEPDDLTWRKRRTFGVLGTLMTPERWCEVPIATIKGASWRTTEQIATEKRRSIKTTEIDAPWLPTALVFRDSYASALGQFLSESFRRVTFVSSYTVFYDLIDQLRPDVVIYERGERALPFPPVEPEADDARAQFGDLRLGSEPAVAAQRSSRTALAANRYEEALLASETALELATAGATGRSRVLVHRARIFLGQRNEAAALECLRHAATLEPDAAMPWVLSGHVHRAGKQVPGAAAAFERATALEPGVPSFWEGLAECRLDQNDPAGAIECLHKAMAIDDFRWQSHVMLSRAARLLGDLDLAKTHARKAVESDGASRFALSNLASILIIQKDWHAARDVLRIALELHPVDAGFEQYLDLCEAKIRQSLPATTTADERREEEPGARPATNNHENGEFR